MIAPARLAAFDALAANAIRNTDLPAALASARHNLSDPRDHTLVTELVNGTVRMRRAVDHQLAQRCTRPLEDLDAAVLVILRLGGFQILCLDRIPPSAAVHDAVALTRRAGKSSAGGMVNAVLRRLARDRDRVTWPDGAGVEALGTRYSHPDWLVERWLARVGPDRTRRWLEFNNESPRLCLAVVRAKGSREELAARLAAEGVQTRPTVRAPHGLVVETGAALNTTAYREGCFLVQDEASQLVCELGRLIPGQRALDLCASPGGKTVALSGRLGGAGLIVACDVRPRRVRLLATTLARAGLASVPLVQVPPDGSLPFQSASFDYVLVDAPCSGLGTLRRDPDIRWTRRPDELPRLAASQATLLRRAADAVRPGGTLVYSTCSSEPEENEAVVAAFLDAPGGFTLVHEHRTLPPDDALEGFYGAVMARNL